MKKTSNIIPKPYSVEFSNEKLCIPKKEIWCDSEIPVFIKSILSNLGFSFSKDKTPEALSIKTNIAGNSYPQEDFLLNQDEAYILFINTKEVIISASTKKGFFYAFISLTQLLMDNDSFIPCMTIYDKPAFSWRGFLLDTCRHFFSVDFIRKMLDQCAFHKINTFHWHLTDDQGWRLPVEKYPLLTEKGSIRQSYTMPASTEGTYEGYGEIDRFYSHDEIREIIKYAEERNIVIVPEIEFPGHASALLASYPDLGCTGGPYTVENRWGIFPDVLCLGNEKVFQVYDDILSTVEKLFPGQYIHIGGDECLSERWADCPKCRQKMKEHNLDNANQLQSWATSRMLKMVLSHNRIPIGWDECLENTEKIPVSKELVIQSWQGFEGGEKAVRANHKVIMSPQSHCYLNLKNISSYEEPGRLGTTTLEKAYSFLPYTDAIAKDRRSLIMGGECAFWSETITASKTAEYLIFPRLSAMAECFWLPEEKKSFEEFNNSLKVHKLRLKKMNILYFE